MDDDFDRAARKHRLTQRQGAVRAQQRQRQEEIRRAEAQLAASSAAESVPSSASAAAAEPVSSLFAGTVATPLASTIGEGPSVLDLDMQDAPCPGEAFVCFICTEAKGADERFLPHRCAAVPTQMCCRPCLVAWVESQISAEAAEIRCCHCDQELSPFSLQRLVSTEHWNQYCETNMLRTLRRDASFIWCSKCNAGGWVDPRQPTSGCAWSCPECSASWNYCAFCRREHGTITCKRFQNLRHEVYEGKKSIDTKTSEGIVERSAKMCPSCRMPIQKDGGCNFMDCPNCRRHFCWSCGRVMKSSHQKHVCDAGFEGSAVVAKTPGGRPCVELTRLFMNVLEIDSVELLNTSPEDLEDLKVMLVPGLSQETRSPLFVGPSECDGEILMRLPFSFRDQMSWELTHIKIYAAHPPAPGSRPPSSLGVLPNKPNATFTDFEDPTAVIVPLEATGPGTFVASLESFRAKGIFKRVICLTLRLSVDTDKDGDGEVFINGLALFGVPGNAPSSVRRNYMFDDRANLIVSPVLNRKRWGEEAQPDEEKQMQEMDDASDGDRMEE